MKQNAYIPDTNGGKAFYYLFSLMDYDSIPILFVCCDDDNKIYLCDCVELRECKEWVIAETTVRNLIDVVEQRLSVYDALSCVGNCYYVIKSYETDIITQKMCPFNELTEEETPAKDAMLRFCNPDALHKVRMLHLMKSANNNSHTGIIKSNIGSGSILAYNVDGKKEVSYKTTSDTGKKEMVDRTSFAA